MKVIASALLLLAITTLGQRTPGKAGLAPTEHTSRIPPILLGTWNVGSAFDTPGPTDLNERQLLHIEKSQFEITPNRIKVCGRSIPIKKANQSVFTPDQFATRYGLLPTRIGLSGGNITEVDINPLEILHSCGEFSDPGTDVIFDVQHHFAIEVDNLYFKLSRAQ